MKNLTGMVFKLLVYLALGLNAASVLAASVEERLAEINRLAPGERQKRLEEGAKRDAGLKFYSNENIDLLKSYTDSFMRKYPFIKAEFGRGSGARFVSRLLIEHRSGKLDADVISVPFEAGLQIKRAGVRAPYRSPELQSYAKTFSDEEGYWHSNHINIAVIAYNTNLVRPEESPRDYPDLLNPKWKGDLSIDLEPERVLVGWLVAWGEKKTREFVRRLMQNGAVVRRGHNLQIQLLCAGEFKIGVELYAYRVAQTRHEGKCPIAMSFPNPTPGSIGSMAGIARNAPHPHAAALFSDFILSADGARTLASTGRIPVHKEVKSIYEEVSQLEQKGVPVLLVPPEKADELGNVARQIMEEILVRRQF
ncbi:MAG: ABC transporter substrate-binding protein [Deltaproteobacteria bacterium]|nr:ABC transporter substrate-binding protein [Deltaproteobacteria bacterium]